MKKKPTGFIWIECILILSLIILGFLCYKNFITLIKIQKIKWTQKNTQWEHLHKQIINCLANPQHPKTHTETTHPHSSTLTWHIHNPLSSRPIDILIRNKTDNVSQK